MSAAVIVAPSDAQLAYIAGLCEERGIEPLPVVYSKDDASRCISAIRSREYRPGDYAAPGVVVCRRCGSLEVGYDYGLGYNCPSCGAADSDE